MVISDPDIDMIKNENIDFILIGCDGIWEGKDIDWYFDTVHEKLDKGESAEEIV